MPRKSLEGRVRVGQIRGLEISGRKNSNEGAELKTGGSFHGEPLPAVFIQLLHSTRHNLPV